MRTTTAASPSTQQSVPTLNRALNTMKSDLERARTCIDSSLTSLAVTQALSGNAERAATMPARRKTRAHAQRKTVPAARRPIAVGKQAAGQKAA